MDKNVKTTPLSPPLKGNKKPTLNATLKKRIEKFELCALLHGTDKFTHGYMPHYAKHLPEKPKRILEIGCWKGDSLRMWRELFPDAELHTLDLFGENKEPTDIPGLICHKGSQSDVKVLQRIIESVTPSVRSEQTSPPVGGENADAHLFDVVIDDGSHNTIDQNATINFLLPFAKMYIVEDLHCCTEEFYRNGFKFEETILGRIKAGKFAHQHDLYLEKIVFIHQ